MIRNVRSRLDELPLGEFVTYLLEASGYTAAYRESLSFDAEDRLENIEEFVKATYEFQGVARVSLPQFLDQVALVSDVDSMDDQKGAVPLMTAHLSKGLEFPVVYMVGMEEGLFPHSRSMDDDDEIEEERRLCYVGMTRAKEKLYMTFSSRRFMHGREQYNLPSRFIDEIDDEFVERDGISFLRERLFPKLEVCHSEGGTTEESPVERVKRGILRFAQDDIRVRKDARRQESDDDFFDQRPDEEKMLSRHSNPSCHPEGEARRTSRIKPGTKVHHPVFGDGIIQKVEGSGDNQKVMIRFRNGQLKTIVVKYAQLEIIP